MKPTWNFGANNSYSLVISVYSFQRLFGTMQPYIVDLQTGGIMKVCVLKIDSENARIFDFPGGLHTPHVMHEVHVEHHQHSPKDTIEPYKGKFFHQVAGYLQNNADKIYLLGSKLAVVEFSNHLKAHHHEQVFKKIVGTEVIESKSTDGEVFNRAKIFFEKNSY